MKLIVFIFALLCLWLKLAIGVEPMPNGVRVFWNRGPNEVSYGVWQMTLPSQNWTLLGTTVATNWVITNAVTDAYNWGITALRMSNGVILPQVDVGIAHWPPNILAGQKTVRLTPVGGYSIDTNRWVKVSSDLQNYDDWMRFNVVNGKVVVEHLTSPMKPHAIFVYPVSQVPPALVPAVR